MNNAGVWGVVVTAAIQIIFALLYVGRTLGRIEAQDKRLDKHDTQIEQHADQISDHSARIGTLERRRQ